MTPVLPTTRAGAERAILLAFVGWRVAVLAQMLPALPAGSALSPLPSGYLAAAVAVLGETVAACLAGLRHRRTIGAVWTWGEVTGACALTLAMPSMVPPGHRIGSWVGFAPGVMLAVVGMAGASLTRPVPCRWLQLAGAATASCACYLIAVLPSAPEDLLTTVVGNALTYPTFALVVGVVTVYVRRMAADADRARVQAADAAALVERRRNQLLLHDSAGILQLVASEDTVPDLAAVLRHQAAVESARIRAFLQAPDALAEGPMTLARIVRLGIEDFGDLPIDLVLDLGGSTLLGARSAQAVRGAIRALLHNVRMHASARSVVIHADTGPLAGEWELSVRDDGRGYDMTVTPPGFGLAMQVHHALAACGVTAEIHSEPGDGTVAVLHGQARSAEP